MKKILAAVILCTASHSYAASFTIAQVMQYCENKGKFYERIAQYKKQGLTLAQTHKQILVSGTEADDLINTWRVKDATVVYQYTRSKRTPNDWKEITYTECMQDNTPEK